MSADPLLLWQPGALTNKVVVWQTEDPAEIKKGGESWNDNWAIPSFENHRWVFNRHGDRENGCEAFVDNFHLPLEFFERPEGFDGPEAYLAWLDTTTIRVTDHERGWIMSHKEKGAHLVAFVRSAKDWWHPPFPGGYCYVGKRDWRDQPRGYMHGLSLAYTDSDDSCWTWHGEDEDQWNEIWDYIRNVPDLKPQDLHDLGMYG